MRLNVNYIDNSINITDEYINVIEIENRGYFYRLVNELNQLSVGEITNNIAFYNIENNEELNMINKIELYIDYFNIDINTKKNINYLYKNIKNNIPIEIRENIIKYYSKIKQEIFKSFQNYDFEISLNDEFDIEDILKILKISINKKEKLLENLILLIDINKLFNLNQILIFINLKQYLSNNELIELYKYSIYNNINILLIDSQCYGGKLEYEKKLIIDSNLDEFLI